MTDNKEIHMNVTIMKIFDKGIQLDGPYTTHVLKSQKAKGSPSSTIIVDIPNRTEITLPPGKTASQYGLTKGVYLTIDPDTQAGPGFFIITYTPNGKSDTSKKKGFLGDPKVVPGTDVAVATPRKVFQVKNSDLGISEDTETTIERVIENGKFTHFAVSVDPEILISLGTLNPDEYGVVEGSQIKIMPLGPDTPNLYHIEAISVPPKKEEKVSPKSKSRGASPVFGTTLSNEW